MVEYSGRTQILATCHSPDMLDSETMPLESILVAASTTHGTRSGPVDDVERSMVRDGLATMGELVRTTPKWTGPSWTPTAGPTSPRSGSFFPSTKPTTDGEPPQRKQRRRCRWPNGVGDEVLARLLELNAERAREES